MKKALAIVVLMVLATACATSQAPQRSQLEIRQFQTREYQTTDSTMVMKAVLNVLQDEGFIVQVANTELGLLTASKEIDVEKTGQAVLAVLFAGANARWNKAQEIEATANVSCLGQVTRVRLNFQTKTVNNKGETVQLDQVLDEAYYQEFFSSVDKGIFLETEQL